jgi:hypothetical protein
LDGFGSSLPQTGHCTRQSRTPTLQHRRTMSGSNNGDTNKTAPKGVQCDAVASASQSRSAVRMAKGTATLDSQQASTCALAVDNRSDVQTMRWQRSDLRNVGASCDLSTSAITCRNEPAFCTSARPPAHPQLAPMDATNSFNQSRVIFPRRPDLGNRMKLSHDLFFPWEVGNHYNILATGAAHDRQPLTVP